MSRHMNRRQVFDQEFANRERQIKTGFRLAVGMVIAAAVAGLGLMGFGIWAIIKLLEHFSVL